MSDELERAFTHAHSVKCTCDRAAAEIEKMRRYLELPVHGEKEKAREIKQIEVHTHTDLAFWIHIQYSVM